MSIRFDTGGESYNISTSLPSNTIPSTVSMWVLLVVDTNTYQIFFNDDDTNYLLGCDGTGQVLIFYNGSDRTTSQTLALGTWYHVALVASGTSRRIYLNGALVLDYTDPGSSDVPASYYIGSSSGGSFTLNGRLGAFKMWTAALTQAEVQREMRSQRPVRVSDLYAFWPMLDVGNGGTDFSAFGRNLSASGTLTTEDNPPVPWELGLPGYFLQSMKQ